MTATANVQEARALLLVAVRATLAADQDIAVLRQALSEEVQPWGLALELVEVAEAYTVALAKMQRALTTWRVYVELAERYAVDKGDEGA